MDSFMAFVAVILLGFGCLAALSVATASAAWGPNGIAAIFHVGRLRRLGHHWASYPAVFRLLEMIGGRRMQMIPRYEDVAVIPGFDSDPIWFLAGWIREWSLERLHG